MTQEQHPITPPRDLVYRWWKEASSPANRDGSQAYFDYIVTKAVRWAADQELEACCEWLMNNRNYSEAARPLRAARRPNPPSLKEQAIAKLDAMEQLWEWAGNSPSDLVRRALEALPDD